MELTEQFDWQGRKVAWGRAGTGPPVVFCHGTPFSSVLWQAFAEAMSRDFTVHLWDMPGYGRSSKQAGHPVDFGVQAEVFTALLAHWGLDRPHVVAHDFGGAVSLRAHLTMGVGYASLMLIDVVAIPPSGSPFFKFVQDHPGVLDQLPSHIHTAIVRTYIQGASHRGLRDDDLDSLVRPWTGEDGQPAFYRQITDYDERFLEENERHLGRIDIPTRIVWGAQDTWIPTDIARRLQGLIPTAELSLVEGSGHLIHHDAPVALMNEVRSWLTRVRDDTG
ncbi:alpha/beta hydrolase [Nonomuraea sp. K274]|uniref:Alpha/beta hydrolase n=1 Tax=Nonomuraea cypriaca TaxID=1187855 RepID=A0A931F4E8_9ACTN|nr:alpha/beta hydrolase [Nonomuraea cypriaca]MBF8193595.1 alpha/beta hydrolase [Nonomuraea cypriaca]